MKINTRQSFTVVLLYAAALCLGNVGNLQAVPNLVVDDNITGGTTGTGAYYLDNDGTLLVSSQPISLLGAPTTPGSRILWWNQANLSIFAGHWSSWSATHPPGHLSATFGEATATGAGSFAAGVGSFAEGWCSTAFGCYAFGSGDMSFAVGQFAEAHGDFSLAAGYHAIAIGQYSGAIGYDSWAVGVASFAVSSGYAAGAYSQAGGNAQAYGDYSTAFGEAAVAVAYGSLDIGRYNLGTANSATTWISTDPLFEVGNGTAELPSNALTVYKNGTVLIPKRQGDILMGEFGNPGN